MIAWEETTASPSGSKIAREAQRLDPLQGREDLRRAFRHQGAVDMLAVADLRDHGAAPLRHPVHLVGLHVVTR